MDVFASLPLALMLCGLSVSGHINAPAGALFDVRVDLRIDRSVDSRISLADLEEEAESIWRPYGVRLLWADDATERFTVTAILAGARTERSPAPEGPLILGRAFVDPSRAPTKPIRVSVAAAEETLALRRNAWTSFAARVHERELARTLGRVLAHEIGHVLLAVRSHEETGLMRAVFRPEELAKPDRSPFQLTTNARGRLRSRIERLRTP